MGSVAATDGEEPRRPDRSGEVSEIHPGSGALTTHRKEKTLIERLLEGWVGILRRFARLIVLFTVLLSVLLLYYAATHMGISTDTADMLSKELPWRKTYLSYKSSFPQDFGEIAIVIDGRSPDLADRARDRLAEGIRDEPQIFRTVFLPGGGKFFRKNGLLFLKIGELEDLSDHLAQIQPFLGKLVSDQSLLGLFTMLGDAMEAVVDGDEVNLVPVFDRVGGAFRAAAENRYYQMSWQELMLGRDSKPDERRRFILVQPNLDFTELFPGKAAMEEIRRLAGEMELDKAHGVSVRLTGSVALADEEIESVSRGAELAGLIATLLVGLLLYAALQSVRLTLVSLTTLIAGLIATAAFAALAVGHLNLISVAFAVLYIGLGIDFSIHICMRYRELLETGSAPHDAFRTAVTDVGTSLILCAVTTAAGFYAFIPTDYTGVSELGLISGTGMFISLFYNLTLLPALLILAPFSGGRVERMKARRKVRQRLIHLPIEYRRSIWIVCAALGAVSLFLVFKVNFDYNPLNLRDPRSESVRTYKDLLADSKTSPLRITLLKPGAEAAEHSAERLKQLDTVDKAVTIADFVPGDQTRKLELIDEMSLLLGPELGLERAPPPDYASQRRSIANLGTDLEAFIPGAPAPQAASARGLLDALRGFEAALTSDAPEQREERTGRLQDSLVSALPERLETLRASLKASRVSLRDLPKDLTERWIGIDGRYRVELYPSENVSDDAALKRFVRSVRDIEPDATGMPVVILEAGKAVVGAFQQAILYALGFTVLLLLVLLRSVRETVLVLVPLVLAGLFTGSVMVIFGIPFNFADIIALPLLLGIGVDNGIHMVTRARTLLSGAGDLLGTGTARAVIFSALTTLAGFGGLAFSRHIGMSTMGQLLTVGLFLTLLTTLIVLPTFLPRGRKGG
jgi:hopanoid biosynthesis associated RND transporter like protein HpnN